jgi:hypothetical protein
MYVPYIASGMLDEEDHTYFNVKGIQINDPSINDDSTMIQSMRSTKIFNPVLTNNSSRGACSITLPEWFVS